jgi:hypothetical protein
VARLGQRTDLSQWFFKRGRVESYRPLVMTHAIVTVQEHVVPFAASRYWSASNQAGSPSWASVTVGFAV